MPRPDDLILEAAAALAAAWEPLVDKEDPTALHRVLDYEPVQAPTTPLLTIMFAGFRRAGLETPGLEGDCAPERVITFEAIPERREVRLRVDARRAPAGLVRSLAGVVKEFPGETPVIVAIETSQGETTLALGSDYCVKPEPDFFAEVKSLLGEAAVA